jgi:hypothetical protein
MSESNKILIYIYVALSIITIGVLVAFYIKCKKNTCSNFTPFCSGSCNCKGMAGTGNCINRKKSEKLYNKGQTEYQNFALHNKGWKKTNFNDYPGSGCKDCKQID